MNIKLFLIRLGGLIVLAIAAGPLYAITVNAMVFLELIPPEIADKAYGTVLTTNATYVWAGCILAGFASIFIKDKWRLIFYTSPLWAPSLFAVLFTAMHQ